MSILVFIKTIICVAQKLIDIDHGTFERVDC